MRTVLVSAGITLGSLQGFEREGVEPPQLDTISRRGKSPYNDVWLSAAAAAKQRNPGAQRSTVRSLCYQHGWWPWSANSAVCFSCACVVRMIDAANLFLDGTRRPKSLVLPNAKGMCATFPSPDCTSHHDHQVQNGTQSRTGLLGLHAPCSCFDMPKKGLRRPLEASETHIH